MDAVNSSSSSQQSGFPVNLEKLEKAKARLQQGEWKKRCIYRVPQCVKGRPGFESYYDAHCRPRIVSLGPYHHGDPRLESMQSYKYCTLQLVLQRTQKDISAIVDVVKNLEHDARACYEDLSDMTFPNEAFMEMLLLDACFILEYLCCYHGSEQEGPVIFWKDHVFRLIRQDMLLLENQIPLFVLNHLWEVLFNKPHKVLVNIFCQLFSSSYVTGRLPRSDEGERLKLSSSKLQNIGIHVQSCVEIVWHSLMLDSTTKEYTTKMVQNLGNEDKRIVVDGQLKTIPSATALKEAGVIFKHKTTSPFWDIEFTAGVLEMPQIAILEKSESSFINLVAFELCHIDKKKYKVMPYISFMKSLVKSASDVTVLRSHGILLDLDERGEEVAGLFHRLTKRVPLSFNQFDRLSKPINEYCNRRRNRWRANLMHNYFNNPWAIISIIAAAFLMLLTILQTTYTIVPFYHKP